MKKFTINLITIVPIILSVFSMIMGKILLQYTHYENLTSKQSIFYFIPSILLFIFAFFVIISRILVFSYKKSSFTIPESINLVLSIILIVIPLLVANVQLLYGGLSLILATTLSIVSVRILPLEFKNMEINILQFHIFICIFLGTTLKFYYIIYEYDFFLHLVFGIVSSVLALPFIRYFTSKLNQNIFSSYPSLVILLMFCFSITCGTMWEIYEFTIDALLNLNTQNNSLLDTMSDIIANTIGAVGFCFVYYFLKNKKQAK